MESTTSIFLQRVQLCPRPSARGAPCGSQIASINPKLLAEPSPPDGRRPLPPLPPPPVAAAPPPSTASDVRAGQTVNRANLQAVINAADPVQWRCIPAQATTRQRTQAGRPRPRPSAPQLTYQQRRCAEPRAGTQTPITLTERRGSKTRGEKSSLRLPGNFIPAFPSRQPFRQRHALRCPPATNTN